MQVSGAATPSGATYAGGPAVCDDRHVFSGCEAAANLAAADLPQVPFALLLRRQAGVLLAPKRRTGRLQEWPSEMPLEGTVQGTFTWAFAKALDAFFPISSTLRRWRPGSSGAPCGSPASRSFSRLFKRFK